MNTQLPKPNKAQTLYADVSEALNEDRRIEALMHCAYYAGSDFKFQLRMLDLIKAEAREIGYAPDDLERHIRIIRDVLVDSKALPEAVQELI